MSKTIESKPVSWLKPDPNQPRKTFDEDALLRLGESLKVRQNEPLQAKPDGTIIDGERRWRAAKLVGVEALDVIITEQALTETQLRVVRLTSFFHKADLTGYEKWLACTELLCGNPTWQLKDLAETLKVDPSLIGRYVSPSKTTPAWQDALRDGKVGISDCYQASLLPARQQDELLRLKLDGASRDEIARVSRQKRSGGTPAVKLARVRCPLSTGTTVVVSGPEMSLDDLIAALSQALEAARKANRDGLDIKTLSAVMKDKAKAGEALHA